MDRASLRLWERVGDGVEKLLPVSAWVSVEVLCWFFMGALGMSLSLDSWLPAAVVGSGLVVFLGFKWRQWTLEWRRAQQVPPILDS